ncbi:hypothetical protein CWI84_09615 [Idiomarina tyrosinivorans]|uniref:OmpA-like domain-containing protein n=1 Tax=Idiomarina tyrosinivorans TaxID=1445662 RepID=A0A432ZLL6_9GAMM|nr:OmpA family protein [Idiomarina tyrosinivorans]RUO78813.1 hypothetical protein CWI84_09615 [Idiomarina tyrosinivorans]
MIKLAQLTLAVAVGATLSCASASAAVRHYGASLDNSEWQLAQASRLQCELSHTIPRYGKVEFVSRAGKQLNLTMHMDMRQLPDTYGVASIRSIAPKWQPGHGGYRLGDMRLYKQFDGELSKDLAWTLLSELEKGRLPTFFYQDWYNQRDKLTVSLSAVNFRPQYDEFMQCVGQLLPFSFEDISYTVLTYQSGNKGLTTSAKKKLAQISQYLQVDTDLDLVLVDSYTDSFGARYPNQQLSQRRADEIKQFFVQRGVAADRIMTVGHGENRPIASNDDNLGRDKNRRVIVQLSKPDNTGLAL